MAGSKTAATYRCVCCLDRRELQGLLRAKVSTPGKVIGQRADRQQSNPSSDTRFAAALTMLESAAAWSGAGEICLEGESMACKSRL